MDNLTQAEKATNADTQEHIHQVKGLLIDIIRRLNERALYHDRSKLQPPEVSIFAEHTPKLKGTTYGSEEYKRYLQEMKPALDHHYAVNSHHPEHYPNGINDMSLLDLIEMLADWKAATMRHADGDIGKSLTINQKRFGISDQLAAILANTVRELGWQAQEGGER